jgi:hypothetical protein
LGVAGEEAGAEDPVVAGALEGLGVVVGGVVEVLDCSGDDFFSEPFSDSTAFFRASEG